MIAVYFFRHRYGDVARTYADRTQTYAETSQRDKAVPLAMSYRDLYNSDMTELSNPIEQKRFREEIRERTGGYILAGLGFVAGLAWNEAIRALIDYIFPLSKDTLVAKFIYALLITIFVVIIGSYVLRATKQE